MDAAGASDVRRAAGGAPAARPPTSADPYQLFNRKLADFIEDLAPLLGHLADYKMLSASAGLMAAMKPRTNQEYFDAYVAAWFEDQILARDEDFFMSREYPDAHVACNDLGIVPMLKGVWASLAPGDRDAVWAHLEVLVCLNRRCKAGVAG